MADYSAATVDRVVVAAARVVAAAGDAGVPDRATAVVALREAAEAAGADHIVQALRHTTSLREVDQVIAAAAALRATPDPHAVIAELSAAAAAHTTAFAEVFPAGADTTPAGVNLAAVAGTVATGERLRAAVEAFQAALPFPTDA